MGSSTYYIDIAKLTNTTQTNRNTRRDKNG